MPVRVLFFGAVAEAAGTRESTVEACASAAALLADVAARYPALTSLDLLISVNQQYVPHETTLTDGDEVGIFTAVSGG